MDSIILNAERVIYKNSNQLHDMATVIGCQNKLYWETAPGSSLSYGKQNQYSSCVLAIGVVFWKIKKEQTEKKWTVF